jgi:hypothetical protein
MALFLLPAVNAQDFISTDAIAGFISNYTGIPSEWLMDRRIIFQIIIPFLSLWAATLGLMQELRIFRSSPGIEKLMATLMSLATLPTGVFGYGIILLFNTAGAYFAYAIFIGLFFIGGASYFHVRRHEFSMHANIYHVYKDESDRLKTRAKGVEGDLDNLIKKFAAESDPAKRTGIEASINKTRDQLNDIRDRLKFLEAQKSS